VLELGSLEFLAYFEISEDWNPLESFFSSSTLFASSLVSTWLSEDGKSWLFDELDGFESS